MTKTEISLAEMPFIIERSRILPYQLAKKVGMLPLKEEEGVVLIAASTKTDTDAQKEVRLFLGKEIELLVRPKEEVDAAIEQVYYQKEEERESFIDELRGDGEEAIEFVDDDMLDASSDSPVIRFLNMIFLEAVEQVASDIHFEPIETGLQVRYRIDGVLQLRHTPPREYQNQLITRLKVLAKLDIAEKRLPQDGRIKMSLGGRTIDFRVSTVPIVHGERIVLRILDKGNIVLGLDQIDMPEYVVTPFRKAIGSNQGIILVTGPTGSGKTTTLYSGLSELNSNDINIMTIEDPVEYKLPGIAQIGVNGKIHLSFSTGLRHILRQDPDVVMIGEIRDKETAEIAIQASLTGHLVLSTLHTNDAPSAITRLVDMGIEPYLLSSSILAVIAQRLVRKICTHCKTEYTPTEQELHDIGLEEISSLYKGEGCEACFHSGYQGRTGVYEFMPVSHGIKQSLLQSVDASSLEAQAKKEGMRTLREEGALLATQGITTSAEVLRVTKGG